MANKRDSYYFDSFVELVSFSVSAARLLYEVVKNYNPNTLNTKMNEMHDIEHSADIAKHTLMASLAKEFLPPIEREDIMRLSQEIDNVTDCIEDVLQRVYMYNIKEMRADAVSFSKKVLDCCEALEEGLKEFKNFKKSKTLMNHIIKVSTLEEDGDKLYTNAVRSLYTSSLEPLAVVSWTRTFDWLERCCDSCEHVADVMEGIVMNNM